MATQKDTHRSLKALGLKTLGWALCTTKTNEDQTIEYYQQPQRGRDQRTAYLVECSIKGTMICLSVSDSVERVIEGGIDANAAGPEAGEAPSVASVALVSSMPRCPVAPAFLGLDIPMRSVGDVGCSTTTSVRRRWRRSWSSHLGISKQERWTSPSTLATAPVSATPSAPSSWTGTLGPIR